MRFVIIVVNLGKKTVKNKCNHGNHVSAIASTHGEMR
jgi:hypothetical protein